MHENSEVADLCKGRTLVEFYSMAECAAAAWHILIVFYWRLLGSSPATKRYNIGPNASKTHEVIVYHGCGTLAEFYSMADSSTTAMCILIPFHEGCWTRH